MMNDIYICIYVFYNININNIDIDVANGANSIEPKPPGQAIKALTESKFNML